MTVTAAPSRKPRPLSPHLQIYRPQISSVLSILHRATGIALGVGMLVLCWWILAAADGSDAYDCFHKFATSLVGQIMLIGWTWALFYHLCNGIRHLFWDTGRGYSLPAMTRSGWAVVIVSLWMTVSVWMTI